MYRVQPMEKLKYLSHPTTPAAQARKRPKHWYPYAPAILLGTVAAWTYTHQIGLLRVGFLR